VSLSEQGVLVARAAGLGLHLRGDRVALLKQYWELLTAASRVLGLVGPAKVSGTWVDEMLDAVAPAAVIPRGAKAVLDLGSGGGLPGVPVAALLPGIRMTLLDSNRRKAAFLSDVVWRLGLGNCRVVSERAEVVAHRAGERESYDVVLARAVAPLPVLLELALPFVAVGGSGIFHKGPGLAGEMVAAERALRLVGGEWGGVWWYVIPPGTRRALLVVRKVVSTPPKLPRRVGVAGRVAWE